MSTALSSYPSRKRRERASETNAATHGDFNEATTLENGSDDGEKRRAKTARRMMAKCIANTTKTCYISKMESIKRWFKENSVENEDGILVQLFHTDKVTLKLPVPAHAVLAFFRFIGNISLDTNEKFGVEIKKVFSTMIGYRSALVHHYEQQGMTISDELDASILAYMSGYKHAILSPELHGVRSIYEYKKVMEFGGIEAHSSRKGASTQVSPIIEGPSHVHVFVRAGWSMRNVQDRYLLAGAGGNQLVDGAVCEHTHFENTHFANCDSIA